MSTNDLGRQHIVVDSDYQLVPCPRHPSPARIPALAFAEISGYRAAGVLARLLSQVLSWCAPFLWIRADRMLKHACFWCDNDDVSYSCS